MATGDDAAARGMDLVPGSTLANTIDTELNKTRDYIATFTQPIVDATAVGNSGTAGGKLVEWGASGNLAVATPTSGGHAVTKDYADGLVAGATADGTAGGAPGKLVKFGVAGNIATPAPTSSSHVATKGYVDSGFTDAVFDGTVQFNGSVGIDGNLQAAAAVDFPAVYANALGGTWRSLYIRSTGELGWVSSSRRFKKNIKEWSPDRQAILAMQLVQFQYKVAVDPDGGVQHGLIAEQLDELGLDWLVDYGEDGIPEGVRYDLISLALLSVVQDHEDRLSKLENR